MAKRGRYSKAFAAEMTARISVIEEQKYYSLTDLHSKMTLGTKSKMLFSDLFNMVKMVHLKIG